MKMEKNILVKYENFNRFGFDRVKFKKRRVIKYDIDTLKDCHHKSYEVAKIRYNSKNLKSKISSHRKKQSWKKK